MTIQVTGYWPDTLAMGRVMKMPMPLDIDGTPRWLSQNEVKCWEDNGLLRVASKDTWSRRNGTTCAAAYINRGLERIRIEWVSPR